MEGPATGPSPPNPSRGAVWAGWGGVLVILGVGLWLRWPAMLAGYTGDEVSTVAPGGPLRVLRDPEIGVNPPLWRLMFNLFLPEWITPAVGRAFSLVMSAAAIVLAALLGREAGRGWWAAGWWAALLVALHPLAIVYGGQFRIYASWMATALLLVYAMGRVLEPGAEEPMATRRWTWAAGIAAVLLPQWHYMGVPALAGVALAVLLSRQWRKVWMLLPGLLLVLPYVPAILSEPARRVEAKVPLGQSFQKIVALGVSPPKGAVDWFANPHRAWLGEPFHWPTYMTVSMLILVALHLLLWPWIGARRRMLAMGAVAVMGGVIAAGQVQYVREPTMLMMLAFLAPLLGALPAAGWGPLRWAGWLALGWWVFSGIPERQAWYADRLAERHGPRTFLAEQAFWEEDRAGGEVWVHPSYTMNILWFYATGTHRRHAPWTEGCAGRGACVELEGVRYVGKDVGVEGWGHQGLLVSFESFPDPSLGEACEALHEEPGLRVWRCDGREAPAK